MTKKQLRVSAIKQFLTSHDIEYSEGRHNPRRLNVYTNVLNRNILEKLLEMGITQIHPSNETNNMNFIIII